MSTESDTKQATTTAPKSADEAFFNERWKKDLADCARTGINIAVICAPVLALSLLVGRLTKA